ncbi:MAG TPA: carboxypeptidase-like regulatory domain-containing protein [Flavobacteriaceae bacterium]|nr:carboxypeptidase-like regulatory domain-containing protein [Flavobacteriaceae bacterium]
MRTILKIFMMLFCVFSYAQTTVTGSVTDRNSQPLSGATVVIVGTSTGVIADFDGNYSITSDMDTPFSLEASSVGFKAMSAEVSSSSTVNFVLEDDSALDEVVVSASRTPQRIFESPVTIERFGIKDIKNTASADFYDGLENLKGVDINVNSLTFKAINTRGFSTFANTRFVQLVDGMDNSAPALNFPLGNLLGMTETDVLSVELIPGASSALYGANAFNGILLMESKSPFDHQGISGQYKHGITSQDAAGDNEFRDLQVRWGHKFSDKVAMKVNFAYLRGTDWIADSEVDKLGRVDENGVGLTRAAHHHDGINIYGDEVATNINGVAQIMEGMGLLPAGGSALVPSTVVTRTGYREVDLTDHVARSKKADWGLYWRPNADDLEVSYIGKIGTGETVYQGTNRYGIENFTMSQHKLEVKNDNFTVRGYMTSDSAGDSYDMNFTAININRMWKPDLNWFAEYVGGIVNGTLGGLTIDQAHALGRNTADTGRLMPGTQAYADAFESVITNPDLTTGAKFQDESKVYHTDFNYNFGHMWDWMEVQVGGSYRNYELNSSGTIFTDYDGPINYGDMGLYTQMVKDMADDRLRVTIAARYDKAEFSDGAITPRVALAYTAGKNKNHNIRVSYQTGYRNPTTQDLFIGLDVGIARLIGSSPDNPSRYVRDYAVSAAGQALGVPASVTLTGESAFNNSFSAASVQAMAATGNPGLLQDSGVEYVKPEQMQSVEIGWRAKLSPTFTVDANVYKNAYQDFISTEAVISPYYGVVGDNSLSVLAIANGDFETYSAYTNTDAEIESWGATIGVRTKIFNDYDLSANYTKSVLQFDEEAYPDFSTNWNTPEDKWKVQFGNTNLFDNVGFNVAWRWFSDFYWEATFGNGDVPSTHVIDAQINFTLPKWNSTIKIGGANIGGDEYFTAFGSGFIGTQYYISWTANN